MALAWAEVQGLTVAELENYLRSLEPAILLENTLVTNHGTATEERHRSKRFSRPAPLFWSMKTVFHEHVAPAGTH